jgi:hypothetical protein
MIRELKGGRYNAIQAMRVNDALRKAGIGTAHFMLAGGIETRAKDFLESYYRGLARAMRHRGDFLQPAIVQAFRGTQFFEKAKKEGALFTQHGRPFKGTKSTSTTSAMVAPKDPMLREVFLERLRKGKKSFSQYDLEKMVALSKRLDAAGQNSPGMTRRLQKQLGTELTHDYGRTNAFSNFYFSLAVRELAKRGLPKTPKGFRALMGDKEAEQRIVQKSRELAERYVREKAKAERLKGIPRLRQIGKLRERFGFGMEMPGRYNRRMK